MRVSKNRTYRSHFGERLGFLPRVFTRTEPKSIWLHAVSVGEVASAVPLIQHLRSNQPKIPIYLSTSTVAGRRAAERQIASLVNGIFYAPLDFVFCIRRVLHILRPALLIILETEIWPNLYAETRRSGAQIAIVNGRISDRTWPKYLAAKSFFHPILMLVNTVAAQSFIDLERYAQLGIPRSRVQNLGNLKYDAALAPIHLNLPTFGAEKIWVAASTVGPNERGSIRRHAVDEDELVLQIFRRLAPEFPRLLLILAPRQPARFDAVAEKLASSHIPFVRRSASSKNSESVTLPLPGVLLLDTIGELSATYSLADVVFVGGSLAPRGGHNILEPAAAGAPVIVGPHMENFAAITNDFLESSAIIQIPESSALLPAVRELLKDPERSRELGRHAQSVARQQSGATARIAQKLWDTYYCGEVRKPQPPLFTWLLCFGSRLWVTGGRWKRRKDEKDSHSRPVLPVPVVSVGGITIGGSGKTPFTRYLADELLARQRHPAILTRGYRRRSPAKTLVFPPGAKVHAAVTGDEAQIFLRAGAAPIGIGTDRYQTAQILLEAFPETDTLLLDDGFQHARLLRDVDIVLLDGLDPFGGEEAVPFGRLREPLESLTRADIVVVTRAENSALFGAIRSRLQDYNVDAPVFRTRLIPRRWRDYDSGGTLHDLQGRRVAAFCGLGNPQNFWNTLEWLGLNATYRWAFADHHAYTPVDIARLAHQARAHGADLLVTTEKDRMNLPENLDSSLKKMNLAWLEIDLELDDKAGFFEALDKLLKLDLRLLDA